MGTIAQQIQALLFAEGAALTFASLSKTLRVSEVEVQSGLTELRERLAGTGLTLIVSDTEATLAIGSDAREVVHAKASAEFERDIGEAGLEVLAILLYEGPSTRATIDYIRGVNSSTSIRTLLVRGLIERSGNPSDGREFVYRATTDLLAHLGVTDRESLPEYATIAPELATFKASNADHGTEPTKYPESA